MSEWIKTTLSKVLSFSNGRSSPTRSNNLPYPVYGSNGIIGLTEDFNAEANTIVIGRVGSYCGSLYFSTEKCWVTDNAIRATATNNNHTNFIYYLLQSLNLNHWSTGSGQFLLNQEILGSIPVLIPNPKEQKAIASLLGALDDKIELNRQMNETLESMARLFFKDWFVDFGPTRAKAEGLPPYLAPELWSLFPDALDDDDKPVGWRIGTLGNIADGVTRTVDPSEVASETPYIGLEHMPRQSIALDNWEGAGKVTSGKLYFKSGEFLFGKLRPYFHKVGIAPVDGICSTDIVVCKSKRKAVYAFVLSLISSDEFVAHTNLTSTGTKMPRTSWPLMARYEIILPPEPILEAFNNLLDSLIKLFSPNIHQNRTLAQTRDPLLPKLMSGEIRLQEAEKIVEKVL